MEAASAVASSIIAPKLDELREAVAKRGEDVKLALASARLQSSSLTADAEARKSRLRGVVDDIKRLEERLARDRDRADAARLAAGRDEDALAAEADAARLKATRDQDELDALARRLGWIRGTQCRGGGGAVRKAARAAGGAG